MLFWKKYSLAAGYLHYWLHAVNEHSLHAPFIYRLYCEVIKLDYHHRSFETIETVRQSLLSSSASVILENIGATSQVSSRSERKVRSIAQYSLSSPKFSRLLYRLVSHQSSKYIVELGTSLGTNTLYLSLAAPSAQLFTLEGATAIADRAERLFHQSEHENIRLVRGNIDQTLSEVLSQIPQVDLAYIDANHRYEPTVRYFEQLVAKAHEDSVIVVDDTYWSSEMQRAWQYIKQHPAVTLSLDLFDAGIVLFRPLGVKQDYALMF